MLGERYAYDFVGTQTGTSDTRFYRTSLLHYLLLGVRLQECYGWGQPICSPTDGTVVVAQDGWPERNPVHLLRDLANVLRHAFTFDIKHATDFRPLAGNHIILEITSGYAFFAHAQTGSIRVSPGDRVATGDWLANVGHSGNSTAPHLHFHLMDHEDPRLAKGIPCCFREYEVLREGRWQVVHDGIPTHKDRIRRL
jgi:murein DD-endopeptidase MepM/ murein hydrolase activator NlpD